MSMNEPGSHEPRPQPIEMLFGKPFQVIRQEQVSTKQDDGSFGPGVKVTFRSENPPFTGSVTVPIGRYVADEVRREIMGLLQKVTEVHTL